MTTCSICNDTGYLSDALAWDCGQENSECFFCPHKVVDSRKEMIALKESVRRLLDFVSDRNSIYKESDWTCEHFRELARTIQYEYKKTPQ